MAEIIDDEQEKELQRKLRSRTRIRGLLIAVNIVLIGYLCYSVGDSIKSLVNESRESKDFVRICGKSEKHSKKIYDRFVKEVNYGDYMLFDDSLVLTNGYYDKNDVMSFDNIQMINVCSSVPAIEAKHRYGTMGEYVNDGISLFFDNSQQHEKLLEGDYLFYTNYDSSQDINAILDVEVKGNFEHVSYSSPLEDGTRIKTTLYAYENNPALVMNVKYVKELPSDYYDVIIKGETSITDLAKTKLEEKGLKVNIVNDDKIENYFFTNSRRVLEFIQSDEEGVSVNSRVNSEFLKEDSELNKELLGYGEASGSINDFYSSHYPGKLVISVKYAEELSDNFWSFVDSF